MIRKILILTEGLSNPNSAKTACSVIRYRRDEVVGVLDTTVPPQPAQALLEVGGDLPIVNSLDALPEANVLLIGVAPTGGGLPAHMRALVLAACARGMDVESGLHDFLNDDAEFVAAAKTSGTTLRDLRANSERDVAQRKNISNDCLRIHTVGHDCSLGKMVVSIELTRGLSAAQPRRDAAGGLQRLRRASSPPCPKSRALASTPAEGPVPGRGSWPRRLQ